MQPTRVWIRALLGITLVAACLAAAIAPALSMVNAAPQAGPGTLTPPGNLVISSFRFRGTGGPTDQYIEIYNRSCTATETLTGYELRFTQGATTPTAIYTFSGPSASLGPGEYFLIKGPGYTYNASSPPGGHVPAQQDSYGLPAAGIPFDTGGVGLFDASNNQIDAAGFSPDGLREGTALPALSGDIDQSYFRKIASNSYIDTNHNDTDFAAQPSDTLQAASCGTPVPTGTPSPTATATNTAVIYNPSVIISEIGWAGTRSNSYGEWIELYNNTSAAIDLRNWGLYSGTDLTPDITLTGTIPAHGFYLLVQVNTGALGTASPTPGGCTVFKAGEAPFDQVYYGTYGLLSNSGEKLYLHDANNVPVDSANSQDTAWRAGSITNAASMERRGVVPDTSSAWITYANPGGNPTVHDCSGNNVYGTPKQQNWSWGKTQTPTPRPTRTNTPPPPTPFGHMVINEFLPRAGYDWNQDGSVDVYDEFVELENLGPVNTTLTGWKIDVISPGGNTSYALSGLTFKPGDRMVFYGLKSHLALHDMGGTVRLVNNRGTVIDARGYGAVQAPDQSVCRIPDGAYWRFPCFPTPGVANALTGTTPVAPPVIAVLPPPCIMSDIIPPPFRQAECHPFGADIYNPSYWDDQSGFRHFPIPDVYDKWRAVVE